eukprot:3324724-Rhodomonas_salina.1
MSLWRRSLSRGKAGPVRQRWRCATWRRKKSKLARASAGPTLPRCPPPPAPRPPPHASDGASARGARERE